MKKSLLLLMLLCCVALSIAAQSDAHRWTTHLAYRDGRKCVRVGETIYALMGENLLSYNTATTVVTPIDRLSHRLSGKRIAFVGYSNTQKKLVILYADGNIDLLATTTEEVKNLPQLKKSAESDLSPTQLNVQGDNALISTARGVVWLDLKREVIRGFYSIGGCNDATLFGGKLFAALASGTVVVADADANLFDRTTWHDYLTLPIHHLCAVPTALYFVAKPTGGSGGSVWHLSLADAAVETPLPPTRLGDYGFDAAHTDVDGNVVCESSGWVFLYQNGSTTPMVFTTTESAQNFAYDGKGAFWVAKGESGIFHARVADNKIDCSQPTQRIGGFGPFVDRSYFMRYDGDDLLIAAGRLDPYDRENTPQTAMRYSQGKWYVLLRPSTDNGAIGTSFNNATCIAAVPNSGNVDAGRKYVVATARTGIYEYAPSTAGASAWHTTLDHSATPNFVQHTFSNSPLVGANGTVGTASEKDYVRTDGCLFDDAGNLFVLNNGRDTCLWVKTGEQWTGIYVEQLRQAPTLEKTFLDRDGRLWVTSRRTVDKHHAGFLCLDYHHTPHNTDDDVATYRSSFVNQDGTTVNFQAAYAIAQDRDNALWLGTDQGVFKVDDPAQWSRSDFRITQVKVPRNDGTNYADYLMDGVPVTAIAVDGANRKWLGTANNGVFLLSADGITTIAHFTTANSPLFSNSIWAIACHPSSNEVMISTDAGLLSYKSDASQPALELATELIRIFPNPVRPEYRGDIIVEGLTFDSDIKVTNTAGTVVAAGTSIGGRFAWDGRDFSGNRVGSGIYYFHIATADGKTALAGKVALVR